MSTIDQLQKAWDLAAEAIDEDPMRPIRYGMGIEFIKDYPKDIRILDVGCGEGGGLLLFHQLGFTNLYGVEVSEERVKRASEKLGSHARIVEIKPDAPLPYEAAYFDLVVSFTVIEHTLDPLFFTKEISRVLKKDCRAIISSDCYTWRILQILNLYKSLQPVDKALSPFAFLNIFRRSGFELTNMYSFDLPGRGNMYLYMTREIINSIFYRLGILKSKPDRTYQKNFEFVDHAFNLQIRPVIKWMRMMKNYFDDENIFFLQKK